MTPPPPLFSILIPCYRDGAYLAENLASLRAQTLQNFEAIIVNDATPCEETLNILNELEVAQNKSNPAYPFPITILHHSTNKGLAGARNTAAAAAKGTYIYPLDADDTLPPQALEYALHAFQKTGADIVYGSVQRFEAENNLLKSPPTFTIEQFVTRPYPRAQVPSTRAAWEACGGWNEAAILRTGMEDLDYILRGHCAGLTFAHTPHVLYNYRCRRASMSHNMQSRSLHLRRYLTRQHPSALTGLNKRTFLRHAATATYRAHIATGQYARAALSALHLLALHIHHPKMWYRALWNIFNPLLNKGK